MVYDLPKVAAEAAPVSAFDAPDVKNPANAQLQEHSDSLTKAGAVVGTIAAQLQDEHDTAYTKKTDNLLADEIRRALYDPENGFLASKGETAQARRPDTVKAVQEAVKKLEGGLQNDMQRYMFQRTASARYQQAMQLVDSHAMNEIKTFHFNEAKARLMGAKNDALQNWAGWKDRESLYSTNKGIMGAEVASVATLAGIPKSSAQYKTLQQEAFTQLHSEVITNMVSLGMAKQATEYFNAHIQEIVPDKVDGIRKVLNVAATTTEADDLATEIWNELAPKDWNEAIPVFAMAQRAREKAGDNEDLQKLAIAGLKERAGEWNGEQGERKAQNISNVWQQIDSGASLTSVMLSPAWLALSGTEQRQIREAMERDAMTKANRAAAQSTRELTELQREESLSFLKHGDEYLTMSDPNVLRRMSRAQVEAKRSLFGMNATQRLLEKWDAIQNPGRYQEAKLDSDTFNMVARSMDLDPTSKNEGMRNQIGALKFRLEEALNHEMQQRKAPMTGTEKTEFIRKTISEEVLVNGFWSKRSKPVAALTNEEAAKIIIPRAEQIQISEAMAERYKATGNPVYAPTRANLVRWYLKGKMPGYTDFIGDE